MSERAVRQLWLRFTLKTRKPEGNDFEWEFFKSWNLILEYNECVAISKRDWGRLRRVKSVLSKIFDIDRWNNQMPRAAIANSKCGDKMSWTKRYVQMSRVFSTGSFASTFYYNSNRYLTGEIIEKIETSRVCWLGSWYRILCHYKMLMTLFNQEFIRDRIL